MKKRKINIKMLIIIVLLCINITLILVIINNRNQYIEKNIKIKEQLSETTNSNSYISVEEHLSEIEEIEQKTIKPIIIGSWSNSTSVTVNCTSIENYQNLTVNNFLPVITKFNLGNTEWLVAEGSVSCNKTYNSSTGILSITNLGGSVGFCYARTYGNVYLVP